MDIADIKNIRRSCSTMIELHGCKEARVSMVFQDGSKPPPGLPRRELLCVNGDGTQVFSMNAYRLLPWLDEAQASLVLLAKQDAETGDA